MSRKPSAQRLVAVSDVSSCCSSCSVAVEFACALWQRVFPSLRSKSRDMSLTVAAARCVAELAVGFLRLVCNDILLLGQQAVLFEDVVKDCATNDATHVQSVCPTIQANVHRQT